MAKPSQKDRFIREIERRIISGELQPGDRLPPERELAEQMGISRIMVHTGIAQLATMGFIKIVPRKWNEVLDYKRHGTIAVLESIMHYQDGQLDPTLFMALLDSRRLIEMETAALASKHRTSQDIVDLKATLQSETTCHDLEHRIALDFQFHHRIAIASQNPIYPLILQSFEPLQKQFIRQFYSNLQDPQVVIDFHTAIVDAIEQREPSTSITVMDQLLTHGRTILQTNP